MNFYELLLTAKDSTITFSEWKEFLLEKPLTGEFISMIDGVPQGLKYHPEFDVLKHTFLVCQAVIKLNEFKLLEAAFLHDVGKAHKTTIGADRIYSYGHAAESARFVELYKDRVVDFDFTHDIVSRHMDFSDPSSKKLKDNPDLRNFIVCDKIISKGMYSDHFPWYDNFLNGFREKAAFRKQRKSKNKVVIACGISGSGKSTWINEHYDNKVIICPDQIRKKLTGDIGNQSSNAEVWRAVPNEMRSSVLKHGIAVLDATNCVKWQRVEFMSAFNDCKKTVIVFHSDVEESIKRVNDDIESGKDRSNVPEKAIRRQHKDFERSLKSLDNEFNEVIHINKG
jgi:predicted kinase